MQNRQLGNTSLKVAEIGLGCMGMSEFYGSTNVNESIETLHRALQLGVNFFDTADMYGTGANEELLAKAFAGRWNKLTLATKFGIVRDPNHPLGRTVNGRPDYVKTACAASLKRLGVDVIDLYYLHRKDPNVPIEETIGAMSDLVKEGKVRYLGLSEVDAETLEKAHFIHPITALQSEYSLWYREPEKEMIPLCERLHISFVAYSPLGRGFLTNKINTLSDLEEGDYRRRLPRFQDTNFDINHHLVEQLNEIAQEKKCTSAQLSLAWLLAKSPVIIPIPGTKRIKYLEENVMAAQIQLDTEEIVKLDSVFSPAAVSGSRYPEAMMKFVGNR